MASESQPNSMSIPEESSLRQRVIPSADTDVKHSPPSEAIEAVPDLASQAHSPTAALWLVSRLSVDNPSGYRPQGEDRPFTVQNVRIATQLAKLVGYRFLALFIEGQEWRVAAFLAGMMSRGVLPTAKIWASSRMLDMVQASFEPSGVDRAEVIKVAIMSMAFSLAEDGIRHVLRRNDTLVRAHVDTIIERAYLNAQLSLSIPNLSSPYVSSLMYEAGVLAGYENRTTTTPTGLRSQRGFGNGPFDALTSAFSLITNLISISSQLYLMYSALSGGAAKTVGWSSVVLIGLSVAPALLRTVGGFFRPVQDIRGFTKLRRSEYEVKQMAKDGAMKQELILFGLRDWVLAKWDRVKQESEEARQRRQEGYRTYELALGIAEEGIQNSFYVLLALRILPTNLSLGSIRLYQKTVESLLRSLRSLSKTASQVFNVIFFIAAYVEAIELPSHPHLLRSAAYRDAELLDFESYRVDGGMELIATDMGFRYPGTPKDILHGVNLTIQPGTTLAIVGLNGGGKTTLVKALMGLYDYEGSLTLNGYPMASFDPSSIHRRTSCLFQDFSRYSFTLRENVGIGQVDRMGEDDEIQLAIERGGAGGVLDKVGMEGKLSRYGVPSVDNAEEVQLIPAKEKSAGGKKSGSGGLVGRIKRMLGRGVVGPVGSGGGGASGTSGKSVPLEIVMTPKTEVELSQANSEKPSPPVTAVSTTSEKTADAEQSAKLSGGQWQRVALSRAFMRASEADLVVFDEPSASLDPRAESELFERIHTLSHQRQCTTIYISHRFSTVRKADQIAVVEDGTIIECGSHSNLMAKEGRYCELYNLQKGGFD